MSKLRPRRAARTKPTRTTWPATRQFHAPQRDRVQQPMPDLTRAEKLERRAAKRKSS